MATRMQQRRGTAAQWISTNGGNGPILNPGEIGYESDTNKFKIGDGTNHWINLDYFIDASSTVNPAFGSSITFEGATANDFETTLAITDPTADRTITFPDATGTVALTSDIAVTASSTTTFTNKTLTSPKINEDVAVTATATELNYVDGVTSAIQTQLNDKAPLAAPEFTGNASAVNLTISGDLTVNGTTTNLNSTNLVVEDKNIVLGDTATPTDTTADGGGITLKGATDKTFNWVDATDSWTSSEHINLASGKTLKYNGTDLVAAQSGNSGKYLTTDGTSTSWGTVTGYSAPTLGSTSVASGATVTNVNALTINSTTIPTSKTLVVTTDKLSALAATTSAELAGVISDETGSGSLVFGTSPTITPAEGTTTTATAGAGYMGMPQNATTTGAYTLLATDAGKHIYSTATRTITIPANGTAAFPIGTTIAFIAATGATVTIAITTDTLLLAGPGTTGSRTLAAFGMATLVKITATSWMISGNGLT
jgi:hypothetical protein